jgi:hypothetical protein
LRFLQRRRVTSDSAHLQGTTKLKLTFFSPAARRFQIDRRTIGRHTRMVLALSLTGIMLLPSFGLVVSAHSTAGSTTDQTDLGVDSFIIEATAAGSVCREARPDEVPSTIPRPGDTGVRIRPVNFKDAPDQLQAQDANSSTGLTIDLVALSQLQSDPNKDIVIAAFQRAASNWTNRVKSPITISINIDYGVNSAGGTPFPAGVLGSTSSRRTLADYAGVRTNLLASAAGGPPSESNRYNLLPPSFLPTDVGNGGVINVNRSVAFAIGIPVPTPSDPNVATMGFNKNFNFDFDPDDGITPGSIDFISVATHEIGHALGFTSGAGQGATSIPTIWDMFRFRPGTTVGTFPTAQRILSIGGEQVYFTSQTFSLNGQSTTELGLSTGGPNPGPGDGDGRQSSHWKDDSLNGFAFIGIMDPTIPSNRIEIVTGNDTDALEMLGWSLVNTVQPPPPPPPPPVPANDNFANAQIISGCTGSVNGTNAGATQEPGEPNHSPDNGGGSRSIWYQWQAPSTGSVTVTTAGSRFDTVMGIYTGNSVGALAAVGKDDDGGADHTSSLTFNATSGTIYRIAVDGYNNGASGGDFGPVTLNWTASNCSGGSTLQFSQAAYNVNEADGSVTIGVNRFGDTSGPATVNYATSDTAGLQSCLVNNGIASERCDYGTTVGTLRFAAGETSKSFVIPVVNDALVEGTESFTVTLSAPTGATIALAPSVSVTNQNDDASSAAQNPIDGVPFFVTQQYIDFLGRLPDTDGFNNWVGTLGNCPDGGFGENLHPDCDRVHVSAGFFLSTEFQQRGYFAYRYYEVAVDRRPTYAEFVPDMAIVGGPQSPESEELSKQSYTDAWTQRPEFKSRYDALSNSAYVDALEANAEVTVSNKATLVAALNGGTMNRGQVLRNIVESQPVFDKFFNRAFVAMQYFGYLRRDPDTIGFQNWLDTLNADPSNFRHMIFGFLFSTEYRQRFGP